jgi:MFS family permease
MIIQVAVPLAASTAFPGGVVGLLVGIPFLVGLILDVPAGAISDALGRRRPIALGGWLIFVGSLLLSVAGDPITLALGSALAAAGSSLVMWPVLALISELGTSQTRIRVQATNGAVQRVALVASGLLLSIVLGHPNGITVSFLASGIAGLVVVAAALGLRDRERTPRRLLATNVLTSYVRAFHLVTTRSLVTLSAVQSLMTTAAVVVIGNSFLPIVLVVGLGYPPAFAAALLTLRNVLSLVFSLQFGRVSARFHLPAIIVVTNAAAALSIAVFGLGPAAWIPFAAMILQAIGYAFNPATSNLLISAATEHTERALGLAAPQLITRAAAVILPTLLGLGLQTNGYGGVFSVGIIATGVLMLPIVALSWRYAPEVTLAHRGPAAATAEPAVPLGD